MFTDDALDSVGIASVWRRGQQLSQETKGCQTRVLHSAEAEVQTASTSSSGTQTDPITQPLFHPEEGEHPPALLAFLQRVEGAVVKELVKNAKSHAFDGFQVNWEDHSQLVSCRHRLQHPSAQERGLHVTGVTWSCTGSVIACAYGRIDDGDWTAEKSYVCTWNLDRRGLDPKQPDQVIDVPTTVTALSFHPQQPSLIAGGLFSGEVLVWDTSRTQDLVLAQTGLSADSHREPVYQVWWLDEQRRGELRVLSASSGGRVLLWTLDPDQGGFVLSAGYALVHQQVPHRHSSSPGFKARGSSNSVGVTSLALSPWDPDTFLVGSEGGLLLRCSFSSRTPAAVSNQAQSLVLRAPVVFSFKSTGCPIHSIHFSPFHRNLFVSVGTDGVAQLHSLLQAEPLCSLPVSPSSVFAVQWSPTRPLLFAAATAQGVVQICDLGERSLRPVATIGQGGTGHAATCLDFNSQNPQLLAVGQTDGTINIWTLNADLTEQRPRETQQLDHIAKQVAE